MMTRGLPGTHADAAAIKICCNTPLSQNVIVGYVRHVSSAFEIRFVEKWLVEIAESRYIRMLYILLSLFFFCNLYL